MRVFSILLCAVLLAAAGTAVLAADSPTAVTPGQEQWKPQPGNYSMAVLYGDPSKPDYYVVRLKVPANWSFAPHTHPTRENVTVISGTLYAGLGSKLDATKVMAYPAGSFISMPEKLPHYALTKDEGAVFQIDGTGPLEIDMIKPMR